MKIAIVGATGILGQHLVPRLLDSKHSILALSPHPEKAKKFFGDSIQAAELDLLADDAESQLIALLSGYDAVLHIATAIPSDFSLPNAWEANSRIRIEGTQRLLNASLAAKVSTYVQQSITMAYPDGGDEWLNEASPFDSNPERAIAWEPVAKMEALVKAVPTSELRWSILRGALFVGKNTVQDKFIARLKAGRLQVKGDGSNYSSYVRVEDMANAVQLATENAPSGTIVNINADPLRDADYYDQLADYLGVPYPERDLSVARLLSQRCSNQRAKDILGWEAKHSLMPDYLAV